MDQPAQDPVQQAMARRSMGSPAPMMGQPSAPAPQSTEPVTPHAPSQKWVPQDQEGAIIAALLEQLKSSQSLKKEQLAMQSPQMAPEAPMAAPAPAMPTSPQPQAPLMPM